MTRTVQKTDSRVASRLSRATFDNWATTFSDDQMFGQVVSTLTKTYGDNRSDWRQRIKEGNNATTSMHISSSNLNRFVNGYAFVDGQGPTYGARHAYVLGLVSYLVGYYPGLNIYTSSSKADNAALTSFYRDLDSKISKFQGLVFLGELKETLEMVRHPARALRERTGLLLSRLRKTAPRVARHRRREYISDTYLEYAFGARPLVSDIDHGMKALKSVSRPEHEFVRGFGKDEDDRIVIPIQVNYIHSLLGAFGAEWGTRRSEISHKKYYGIVSSSGYGVPWDLHTFGIDLENLLSSAWELIPYSFLVDYFTNIGNIISAASYRQIQPEWVASTSYTTSFWTTFGEKIRLINVNPDDYICRGSAGSASFREISISREPNAELHIPSLEFSVPGFGDLRWANISALTSQYLSARKAIRP